MTGSAWRLSHGLACLALLGIPAAAKAQDPVANRESSVVAPGEIVRAETGASATLVEGAWLSLEPDSLRIEASTGPQAVALDSITRLEVQRGETSNIASGALIGAFVGLGLTAGLLAGLSDDSPVSGGDFFLAALIVVPIPTIIGSVIGSTQRRPRWREVPLESLWVGAGVTSDGGLAIQASLQL